MFGMFQSSRITSGMLAAQASRAALPSSASLTLMPRSSMIRRATFRITAESSTTRQVISCGAFMIVSSSRLGAGGREAQERVHVEDHQEAPVEAVDAGGEVAEAGIQVDRHRLAAVGPELEHLADTVDHEREGLAGLLQADRHLRAG